MSPKNGAPSYSGVNARKRHYEQFHMIKGANANEKGMPLVIVFERRRENAATVLLVGGFLIMSLVYN